MLLDPNLHIEHNLILVFLYLIVHSTAISITGNEKVHVLGSLVDLVCEGKVADVRRIEWINDENSILATENDTNILLLRVNTSGIQGNRWFACKILTYSESEWQAPALISVKGRLEFCPNTFMHCDL